MRTWFLNRLSLALHWLQPRPTPTLATYRSRLWRAWRESLLVARVSLAGLPGLSRGQSLRRAAGGRLAVLVATSPAALLDREWDRSQR